MSPSAPPKCDMLEKMWQIDTSINLCQTQPMPKASSAEDTARIHCRVSRALKEQVETAAITSGQSLTAFIETALAQKAQQVLADGEQIRLSQTAFEAFVEAIQATPSKPSPKLLQAVQDYKQRKRR